MKLAFVLLALISFSASASPFMTVKERLRLHLWIHGIQEKEKPVKKEASKKVFPEELERPLQKI